MSRWEESTAITASAETVFGYVSDFDRHADWSGHGLQVSQDGDGPAEVGTTYSTIAKQFGTQRETSTITHMDRPDLFGWDSTGGLGVVHHEFSLSETDGVTTLTRTAEFTRKSFLAKVLGFRIAKDLPASLRQDLAKIKAAIEADA